MGAVAQHNSGAPDEIALVALQKSFGAVKAFRGVDITIARRQTVALLGPNGAGKTTTTSSLCGRSCWPGWR